MTTIWIHGANSTMDTWTYLRKSLKFKSEYCVEYDSNISLSTNINMIFRQLKLKNFINPIHIVGHSMGGIIGYMLQQKGMNISRLFTISTPFGGSLQASFLKYFFPTHLLFHEVCYYSKTFTQLRMSTPQIPMACIVTWRGGYPIFFEKSDGVVTRASQMVFQHPLVQYKEYESNHYEILQRDDIAKDIRNWLTNNSL